MLPTRTVKKPFGKFGKKWKTDHTLPAKKRNPVHSITPYLANFQNLDSHQNIASKKNSTKSWLHASFDTFWVQIDRLFWEESFFEDLAKYIKCSNLLKKWSKWRLHRTFNRSVLITLSVDLNSKGAKRSLKSWTTRFCEGFYEHHQILVELKLWKSGQYSAMEWTGLLFWEAL